MTLIETRPPLDPTLSGAELLRWYWLRDELASFARGLGVSAAGGKEQLQRRIAAHLDGEPPEAAPATSRPTAQLTGPLDARTVVPVGQRCSQQLRGWFEQQAGTGFRFDGAMRDWFAAADGTGTLGDALAHWHATRNAGASSIDPQFELNRFTRSWHAAHPGGTRTELLAAWRDYRDLPVDARGRA